MNTSDKLISLIMGVSLIIILIQGLGLLARI